MKTKKLLSILLVVTMATAVFVGCGKKNETEGTSNSGNKTEVSQEGSSNKAEDKKFTEKDGMLVYTDTKNSPFEESGLEIQIKKGDKGSAKFIITDKDGKATVDYFLFDYEKNCVEKHKYVAAMGTEFYYYYDLEKKSLTRVEDGDHKDTTEKTKASNRWDKAASTMDEDVKSLEKYYSEQYKTTIKEAVQGK